MIGHDRVGAGIEVRKLNDGHTLCRFRGENFETLFFIRECVRGIEEKNANGLGVVPDSLYCDAERGRVTGVDE